MKKLFLVLAVFFAVSFSVSAQDIDTKSKGQTYDKFWNKCVGAGRANEGLRAGWLEHLEVVKENCGFEYVRFHGLFHDDMFVYFPKENGKVHYNWQYIDELFDRMLKIAVKPFVELAFFPKEMAAPNSKTQFWWKASITPDDNNFGKWHDLVKAFTQHVVDRYGIEEIKTWYFEVWNEPNLTLGFWDGTKSQYFRLYKESALAVKSVDKSLKIGGPSTSNFVADNRYEGETYDKSKSVFYANDVINTKEWKSPWMEDFIAYCEKENLPLDFITTHPYPTDYALDPETGRGRSAARYAKSAQDDMNYLRKLIAKSKYPKAEIHLTEWSTSPSSRDNMHDNLPAAAYIIKTNLDCIGLTNSLSYWTFTDVFEEKGGGETIFHGGFGMINYQGIVKPSFHAYRMLQQLGDQKLYYSEPLFVSKSSKTNKIIALAYNYPKEFEMSVPQGGNVKNYMTASAKKLSFSLKSLAPNANFQIEILDNEHGNIKPYYDKLNLKDTPTQQQTEMLKIKAWETKKEYVQADKNGKIDIEMELSPWECVLIREL